MPTPAGTRQVIIMLEVSRIGKRTQPVGSFSFASVPSRRAKHGRLLSVLRFCAAVA